MKLTADPYHLTLPPLIPLDERHDDWSSQIPKTRRDSPHNRDVTVVGELWDFRVILLEDTEGKREALVRSLSASVIRRCVWLELTP